MIVSRDVDFENIEKTKSFSGYYFILGGSVPILEPSPEQKIRQKELVAVVEKRANGNQLKEIILALDNNPEGENTREHIQSVLGPLSIKYGFKLSSLGRGLSTGSELEYTDPDTLRDALSNRR
jgi:recombination protein RecR